MKIGAVMLAIVAGTVFLPQASQAKTITVCTLLADAKTGETLITQGDCQHRASAASTFKIAISLMGYDAGILKDTHHPILPFKAGYPDWRKEWQQDTDPASWIKYSVVWYSQQITQRLGKDRYENYVRAFEYGNGDVSGDKGKNNGLTRAWLSSSLQISPAEQVAFLQKLLRHELPVSKATYEMAPKLFDIGEQAGGWHVFGKTGAALSQKPDGNVIKGQPVGWFVGWAEKGDRQVVFARLTRDTTRPAQPPGFTARDAILADLFAKDGQF
nr:class D beta-lactamase [Thalassospira marina]